MSSWIAVDWGTSNLRAWMVSADGGIASTKSSSEGMGKLAPDEFEPALLSLIGDWLDGPTDVVCCGMVGAKQGWQEAPYLSVPCAPVGGKVQQVDAADPRLRLFILPGLSQAKPADVMRGEETQIAGFIRINPEWDGVLCLPGTHTKWVEISAGEVVSFRTFMTGELFSLLSSQSVLGHSVDSELMDNDAFVEAVSSTMSRPEAVASSLFSIRADDLLNAVSTKIGRARLSGTLIGAELAASRPYWLGQQVAIIADANLSSTYAAALAAQGLVPEQWDATQMTLAGLASAKLTLEDSRA